MLIGDTVRRILPGVGVLLLLLASCASQDEFSVDDTFGEPEFTNDANFQKVAEGLGDLNCAHIYSFVDSVFEYEPARGALCVDENGSQIDVKSYDSNDAAIFGMSLFFGTSDGSNLFATSDSAFATGEAGMIEELAEASDMQVLTEEEAVELSGQVSLGSADNMRDICVTTGTTLVEYLVTDEALFEDLSRNIELDFPDLASVVRSAVDGLTGAERQELTSAAVDDYVTFLSLTAPLAETVRVGCNNLPTP